MGPQPRAWVQICYDNHVRLVRRRRKICQKLHKSATLISPPFLGLNYLRTYQLQVSKTINSLLALIPLAEMPLCLGSLGKDHDCSCAATGKNLLDQNDLGLEKRPHADR